MRASNIGERDDTEIPKGQRISFGIEEISKQSTNWKIHEWLASALTRPPREISRASNRTRV